MDGPLTEKQVQKICKFGHWCRTRKWVWGRKERREDGTRRGTGSFIDSFISSVCNLCPLKLLLTHHSQWPPQLQLNPPISGKIIFIGHARTSPGPDTKAERPPAYFMSLLSFTSCMYVCNCTNCPISHPKWLIWVWWNLIRQELRVHLFACLFVFRGGGGFLQLPRSFKSR